MLSVVAGAEQSSREMGLVQERMSFLERTLHTVRYSIPGTSSATLLKAVSIINFLQYFVPYENQGCGSALI
jgi:hypothetical protein